MPAPPDKLDQVVRDARRASAASGDLGHALVSPFESLFYGDNVAANGFLRELEGSRSMSPIAAINPSLPDAGDFLGEIGDGH